MRRVIRWVRNHPSVVSHLVLFAAVGLSFRIDADQDARERREDAYERVALFEHDAATECEAANTSRELIREIGVELSMANAEALISVATDAKPETVEAYRSQARERAEVTVSVLEDRDCVAAAAEARRLAAAVERVSP